MDSAQAICVLAMLLAACQAPPIDRAPEYGSDLVVEGKRIIAAAPAKDKNLWRLQVALVALKEGRYGEARALFAAGMPEAGTVLVGDASTRRARSLFHPEESKVFYGEPHERAMGWFYRGILYWRAGEPDVARACFRHAQLFDASPSEKHRGDWILFDYLSGLVSAKLSGNGHDDLRRARTRAGDIELPDYDSDANVLVFLQYGFGPIKKSRGDLGEGIVYTGGNSLTQFAMIRAGGQSVKAPALDNLTFQATTRDIRQADWILARKARVKKTADLVGDVSFLPGVILTQPEGTRDVGLALLGTGLVAKAVGGSTQPRSDTRTWNNLPQHLAFASLRLPPGEQPVEVDFFDANKNLIPALSRKLTINVKPQGDTIVFVADK